MTGERGAGDLLPLSTRMLEGRDSGTIQREICASSYWTGVRRALLDSGTIMGLWLGLESSAVMWMTFKGIRRYFTKAIHLRNPP